eukprot:7424533-Pyramimonas_sp.AAC.1
MPWPPWLGNRGALCSVSDLISLGCVSPTIFSASFGAPILASFSVLCVISARLSHTGSALVIPDASATLARQCCGAV